MAAGFYLIGIKTSYVYTLVEKGYTKLNYETAKIIQSKNIEDFPEDDRCVFEKLEIKVQLSETFRRPCLFFS